MARLWCKALRHLFPDEPKDGEPTHDEVVNEARRAMYNGQCQLEEAGKLRVTVEREASSSRLARNRNHFSERVVQMLREER